MPWERSGGDDQGHYRLVPYTGVADSETQIRGLQALAMFFGLRPAAVARCRVLELGCAAGRNLLPQAAEFPGSEFTGLDAAADQVADGRAVAVEAGMANVDLRHARIESVDASWGQFDYILCAGVFSWVPSEVRDQVFRVCRENLAPDGVAVVTYNALPGWHLRVVARDLMRCHAAGIDDPREQIAAARAILQFAAARSQSRFLAAMPRLGENWDRHLRSSTNSTKTSVLPIGKPFSWPVWTARQPWKRWRMPLPERSPMANCQATRPAARFRIGPRSSWPIWQIGPC